MSVHSPSVDPVCRNGNCMKIYRGPLFKSQQISQKLTIYCNGQITFAIHYMFLTVYNMFIATSRLCFQPLPPSYTTTHIVLHCRGKQKQNLYVNAVLAFQRSHSLQSSTLIRLMSIIRRCAYIIPKQIILIHFY